MLQSSDGITTDQSVYQGQLDGRLNWVVQVSKPDITFTLIDLNTKLRCGTAQDFIRAMKVIRNLKQSRAIVYFPKLKHDGTVPTCFNQSKASISFDKIP